VTTDEETIVALATPPGRGALAVVRLSGPRAHAIAAAVIRPWPIEARRTCWCAVVARDGTLLDRPVALVYAAPRSYTGEDAVELITHGGAAVPASIVAALVDAGARPAHPGEFTRRAVLNGRMDLAQAEAVGDLVDARSGAMQRAALAQLDGGLSRRVRGLREAVVGVEALIAYDIDFPEEDDGPVSRERIAASASAAADQIAAMLATAPAAELAREGARVVIAGAPNVGKSSLFNALIGRARALVSDVPGTTRDAVDATIEPEGAPFPLHLIDTAGLRDSADVVERLGIEVSERSLAAAHVVLACGETRAGLCAAIDRVRQHTGAPVIGVWTKRDTIPVDTASFSWSGSSTGPADPSPGASAGRAAARSGASGTGSADVPIVEVSASTGAGLRPLLAIVVDVVAARWGAPAPDVPLITRARHRHALERAAAELGAFREAWAARALPSVVAAVHLRDAAVALEAIVGAIDADDVLARVFAEFCVGK